MAHCTRRHFLVAGAGIALAAMNAAANDDTVRDARIPLGILGDSDSHSYHDSVLLSARPRGGEYHDTTYQWTEVLAALREREVDLGEWGKWGTRAKVAAVLGALGFEDRAPRKEDFRFNLALSGAACADLLEGPYRQVDRLLYLMALAPQRWERGVVVIRIGVNDIGTLEALDRFAGSGLDDAARRLVGRCNDAIRRAMAAIRARHPRTAIVLAAPSDNRNLAKNLDRWRDPVAHARIGEVLEWHERELQSICARDPRAVVFSDRLWAARLWGSRDASGMPAYRAVNLGGPTSVTNSIGDHPRNATLADNHAGSVVNALWARDLVVLLGERFGFPITPISDAEVARLVDLKGEFGIAKPYHTH
jgi:lysophospholipase L1-like esterase